MNTDSSLLLLSLLRGRHQTLGAGGTRNRSVDRHEAEAGINDGRGFGVIINLIRHLALGGCRVKKIGDADDSTRVFDGRAVRLNTAFFVGSSDHIQSMLLGRGGGGTNAEIIFAILDNGIKVLLQTVVTHARGPIVEVGGLAESLPVDLMDMLVWKGRGALSRRETYNSEVRIQEAHVEEHDSVVGIRLSHCYGG